jgi:hypothetical protein
MSLKTVCPKHGLLGWSYNTHRRRRFCRLCAYQERLDNATGKWVPAETEG